MTPAATYSGLPRSATDARGLWEPKRTLTLEAARRHSQMIRYIRWAMLSAAALLVLTIIVQFMTQKSRVVVEESLVDSVKMINPRYTGRTADNLPFYLTALTATRALDNRHEVKLEKPVLEFIRGAGMESSFVEAESGSYDDVKKILNLQAAVNLKTDDGYNCQTTHARIFARDKRIEGDQRIHCDGSFGTATGSQYAIEDDYAVFIFKNGMNAQINQDGNSAVGPDDGLFAFGGDGPIDVTADKAVYEGNVTELSGGVTVTQDGARITSQDMTITRSTRAADDSGSLKLGAIETIDARREFHYSTDQNDVRGDRGVYERPKTLITVIGNVTVDQAGGNQAKTDNLTYNVKTETIRFSGQCRGRACGDGNRPSMKINVD